MQQADGRLCSNNFYPRPPRGRRPSPTRILQKPQKFLSTPSARRATTSCRRHRWGSRDFYPRPPRGGRQIGIVFLLVPVIFLSTPSARRATSETKRGEQNAHKYFYPRPPRGGRLCVPACNGPLLCISIHALREEGDRSTTPFWASPMKFLSTPSARRATGGARWDSSRRE